MTSACGVVTKVHEETEHPAVYRTVKERRAALKGQQPFVAVFDTSQEGITYELAQKTEKKLLLEGRHTYLYAPEPGEPYELVIQHLLDSGLVVLLILSEQKARTSHLGCWKAVETTDPEDIAETIRKQSSQSAGYSQDGEHI
jgi:sulfate adenylyltransferase subunit 1